MTIEDRITDQPPLPLAMVICDAMYRDPGTMKLTLLGLFSTIHTRQVPIDHPLCVYVAITDARGKVPLEIRIVDVDEEEKVATMQSEVNVPDPRAVFEAGILFPLVHFPKAGEFRIQAWSGETFLTERRILVLELPMEGQA